MKEFYSNMVSIKTHLICSLEAIGYRIVLLADLMSDERRIADTKTILKNVFGEHLARERTSKFVCGMEQVHSMTSSWDWCIRWLDEDLNLKRTMEAWVLLAYVFVFFY